VIPPEQKRPVLPLLIRFDLSLQLIRKPLHADGVDGTGRFAQETYSAVQPFQMIPVQMGVKMGVKLFLLINRQKCFHCV
jgi:hypothetical protein